MPFIDDNEFRNQLRAPSLEDIENVPSSNSVIDSPKFTETLAASFKQQNIISNIYDIATRESISDDIEDGFDSLTEQNLEGYEDYADRFIDIRSEDDSDIIKSRIDRERDNREVLQNSSSTASIASALLSGVVDPTILFPVAKIATTASRLNRAAQGFKSGLAFGAGAAVARESVLQASQETRTTEEGVVDLVAETALGGILGASIGALSKGTRAAATVSLSDAMRNKEVSFRLSDDGTKLEYVDSIREPEEPEKISRGLGSGHLFDTASTGAEAEGREVRLRAEGIARINDNLTKALSGAGMQWLQTPLIRGLTSPFAAIREFTNSTYLHNLILNKNVEGISKGEVAENIMRQREAVLGDAHFEVDKLFREATGLHGVKRLTSISKENRVKYHDFHLRVSRILRDETIVDNVPQINAAAKIYREQIDSVTKRLIEVGILDKGVKPKTARNYLTRAWNTALMTDRTVRDDFTDRTAQHLIKYNQEGNIRAIPLNKEEAFNRSQDIYDNIMGQGDRAMEFNSFADGVKKTGKFTKERVFTMLDSELESFLVNDAPQLVTNFVRRGTAIAETQAALQRMGHASLSDLKKDIKFEHEQILGKLDDRKARAKATAKFHESIELVDKMYSSITGTLRKPQRSDRWLDTLKTFQFARLLGGSAISQIPEMAMPFFAVGLAAPIRHGVIPFVKSIKSFRLSAAQLKDLDIGNDLQLNSTLRTLGGIDDSYGSLTNEWTRANNIIADKFGRVSGLTPITHWHRMMAGQIALGDSVRVMEKAVKTGKMPQKQRELFAASGIGDKELPRIARQIDKYGEKLNGSVLPNMHLWEDEGAAKAFAQYLQNKTDSVVFKPGKGDIPFFAQQSNLGKVIFQFKSFMATATNRLALPALQRRDIESYTALAAVIAMGTVSGILKSLIAGKSPKEDAGALVLDGISRAGVPGLFTTAVLDTALMGARDKTRRYVGKFALGQVFGPSVSLVGDIADFYGRTTKGTFTASDGRAFERLMPFTGLFWLQAPKNNFDR